LYYLQLSEIIIINIFLDKVPLCSPGWPQIQDLSVQLPECCDYRHEPPLTSILIQDTKRRENGGECIRENKKE
jgi:hypothetical protein